MFCIDGRQIYNSHRKHKKATIFVPVDTVVAKYDSSHNYLAPPSQASSKQQPSTTRSSQEITMRTNPPFRYFSMSLSPTYITLNSKIFRPNFQYGNILRFNCILENRIIDINVEVFNDEVERKIIVMLRCSLAMNEL